MRPSYKTVYLQYINIYFFKYMDINQLITTPSNLKSQMKLEQMEESSAEETHNKQHPSLQHLTYFTGEEPLEVVEKLDKLQIKCYKAIQMIKEGATIQLLAEKLNVTLSAAHKLNTQYSTHGKIYLPRGPKPSQSQNMDSQNHHQGSYQHNRTHYNQQGVIHLNGPSQKYGQMPLGGTIGFNTKLPNQTVQKIKKILLKVIKQEKMQSYQQMQQHLKSMNIYRSLSSIYRHVNSLKAIDPQLQSRNFAMHKKDISGSGVHSAGNGKVHSADNSKQQTEK